MENKDQYLEAGDSSIQESKSDFNVQREFDSMDDFEHLGHDDSLNQKRNDRTGMTMQNEAEDLLGNHYSDDLQKIINKRVDSSDEFVVTDELEESHKGAKTVLNSNIVSEKMNSLPNTEDKTLDEFLQNVHGENLRSDLNNDLLSKAGNNSVSYDFITAERGLPELKSQKNEANFDLDNQKGLFDKLHKDSFSSVENLQSEDFKDVKEEVGRQIEQPGEQLHHEIGSSTLQKQVHANLEFKDASSEKFPDKPKTEPKTQVEKPKESPVREPQKVINQAENVIDAEVFFCKMGLNTWFNPEKLNPKVESLIYWRDPKKSGAVFAGVLLVLLALTYFSLISVVAYLSLLGLTGTISFRVYKNVVQAVQKTGEGHPFKEFLEWDLSLPPEKVKEISEVVVAHVNASIAALRRLFLVEDLIDSIKFGVFMWTLTYLGSWFNGMTLVILAWVALFSLPKVYETNKTEIDANLEFVKSKLTEVTAKVKAAVPLGKKEEKTE